jgi:hypothetical protein
MVWVISSSKRILKAKKMTAAIKIRSKVENINLRLWKKRYIKMKRSDMPVAHLI